MANTEKTNTQGKGKKYDEQKKPVKKPIPTPFTEPTEPPPGGNPNG